MSVLGPLRVDTHSGVVAIGAAKERAVMALLALRAGRAVSTDELIAALWGDGPPRSARKALQGYVWRLRQALPNGLLSTTSSGYVLSVPPDVVDATRFEQLAREGRRMLGGGQAEAVRPLSDALALWQGRALEDLVDQPLGMAEAARLEEVRRGVEEDLVEDRLAAGQHEVLVAELEAAVAAEPLRERRWAQLMIALYRCGRQAEALRAFRRLRYILRDQLGIEPSHDLVDLEQRILLQDADLDRFGAFGGTFRAREVGFLPHAQVATVPLPPRLQAGTGTIFVGRAAARALIAGVCKEAGEGGGRRIVLVSGEPGIGKTALVAEAARAAHAAGGVVAYGRWDDELGIPYHGFAEALGYLVAQVSKAVLDAHVRSRGGELSRLIPEMAQRTSDLPAPHKSDPDTERSLLYGAVAHLLAVVSAEAPVVLVLDDLHCADRPSILLLRYLVSSPEPMRAVILGTYRTSEISRGHPFAAAMAAWHAEKGLDRVPLSGLEQGEIIELMEAAAGRDVDQAGIRLAGVLHRETGGNPFFVTEVLRLVVESKLNSQRIDERWQASDGLWVDRLPQSVRDVVIARVVRLGRRAEQVLLVAAVIGIDFDVDLLARTCDMPEDELIDILDQAATAALVKEAVERAGRYSFAHALIQHTLYEDLGVTRRTRIHKRVAEVMELIAAASAAGDSQEVAALPESLAFHFMRAGDRPDEVRRAIRYSVVAADKAVDRLAFEEAAALLERARDRLAKFETPDPIVRLEILLRLAEVYAQLLDMPAMTAAAVAAAEDARRLCSPVQLAQAAVLLTNWVTVGLPDPRIPLICEEALSLLSVDNAAKRAEVLAGLAAYQAMADWGVESELLAREALALAERSRDERAEVASLLALIVTLYGSSAVNERLQLIERALNLADEAYGVRGRSWFLRNRATALLELGDSEGFRREVASCSDLAHMLGSRAQLSYVAQFKGLIALAEGRFEAVEGLASDILEYGAGDGNAPSIAAAQLLVHRREQGGIENLVATCESMVALAPDFAAFRLALALALLESGALESALATVLTVAPDNFAAVARDAAWTTSLAWATEVVAAVEDRETARTLASLLAPHAGHFIVVPYGTLCLGAVDRYLGMLAATMGELQRAVELYQSALAVEARFRAPPFLARTSYWYSRALLDSQDVAARNRGCELLDQSLATAREYGMEPLTRQAELLRVSKG